MLLTDLLKAVINDRVTIARSSRDHISKKTITFFVYYNEVVFNPGQHMGPLKCYLSLDPEKKMDWQIMQEDLIVDDWYIVNNSILLQDPCTQAELEDFSNIEKIEENNESPIPTPEVIELMENFTPDSCCDNLDESSILPLQRDNDYDLKLALCRIIDKSNFLTPPISDILAEALLQEISRHCPLLEISYRPT